MSHLVAGPEPRPTVVLVHGAFADSSSWNSVVGELRRQGYPVVAVANPLRGLQEDAAYVRSVLASIDGPIVIAGHSYGGSVLSEAADGDPRVVALVFVASFLLEVGESTSDLAGKFPGGQLGATLTAVPFPAADGTEGSDLYIQQEKFHWVFASDLPEDTAALMAATQRPIAAKALEDKATKAAWKTIPSWSVVTLHDLAVPAEAQRFMSTRASAQILEIDASHAAAVSVPSAVTRAIVAAAESTVSVAA